MLDINLFRADKGFDPEIIRKSQRLRFKPTEIVDEIILLDKEWRLRQFELEQLGKDFNKLNREVAKLRISGGDASAMMQDAEKNRDSISALDAEEKELKKELYEKLAKVGNLVHDSVFESNDEENNVVERTWGEKRVEPNLKNHVELVELLGIADMKKGANVAGGRGYYLQEAGVFLNQAIIQFGLSFLRKKGYKALQPPFFMRQEIMAKCAQLAQFDEELYKVTGEGDDKYLIATAEQPLCCYHIDDWIHPSALPIKYSGYSSCFRKEAGSHGRDTLGIFRVHQFEKVEQFVITSPNDNDSWNALEEMITNSEEFYQLLKLPYRVASIVSGALNDAASKKYDLEAWFPASATYRELVSCSNCTDYQSRMLNIRYGQNKRIIPSDNVSLGKTPMGKGWIVVVINSTLTATERTICCILENYQTAEGVIIPEVLHPYMDGMTFLPFPVNEKKKTKKPKA